jgi:beta-hydroxylase
MPGVLPRVLKSGLKTSVGAMEAVNRRFSRVGTKAIFDPSEFPWIPAVESEWRSIRSELDTVLKYPNGIPNFQDISVEQKSITNDDNWKTFFFYGYGIRNDFNCEICPSTARILAQIPGMKTAFFSILFPGKRIPSHRGPYNGVLRYHLGLIVPEPERCGIIVDGSRTQWLEGKSLVFDDSFQHEAWNESDEIRVVLFVDFLRPLRTPVAQINKAFVKVAGMSDFIQAGMKRQQKWNAAFAELYNQHQN